MRNFTLGMRLRICILSIIFIGLCRFACPLGAQELASPDSTLLYAVKGADSLFLDVYRPSGENAVILGQSAWESENNVSQSVSKPTVLFLFGGGFYEGNRRDRSYLEWFKKLMDKGYGVVAIDYRLGLKDAKGVSVDGFTTLLDTAIRIAVEDLFSSVTFLFARKDLGINVEDLVVSGSSAGAITAMQAEYEICTRSPLASSLPSGFNFRGVMAFSGAILIKDGGAEYSDLRPCPVMMMHGTDDSIVPYSVIRYGGYAFLGPDSLAKFLSDNAFEYRFYRYSGNNHSVAGFMNHTLDKQTDFLESLSASVRPPSIDLVIDDPTLPHYPEDNNLYDLKP